MDLEVVLWGKSNLHCQQSSPLAKNQTWISSSSIQKKPQGSTDFTKVSRNTKNTTRSSLVHFTQGSYGKQRSERKAKQTNAITLSVKISIIKAQWRPARQTNARVSSTVCWVVLTLFPNITCPLKHPLQKNITYPFTRQLPEIHHVTQRSLQLKQKSPLHLLLDGLPDKYDITILNSVATRQEWSQGWLW